MHDLAVQVSPRGYLARRIACLRSVLSNTKDELLGEAALYELSEMLTRPASISNERPFDLTAEAAHRGSLAIQRRCRLMTARQDLV
jgi:hypothetical protein